MKISCVYFIINRLTGVLYIGSTTDWKTRRNKHKSMLRRNEHPNKHLQSAYNKVGIFYFTFHFIECPVSDLAKFEQTMIDFYGLSHLYNHSRETEAERRGMKHSQETKRQISQTLKQTFRSKGKKFNSLAARQKMSESAKRKKIDDHYRDVRSFNWLIWLPNAKDPIEIRNLRKFCRENGLHQSGMQAVAKGKASQHKGYRCKRA